MARYLRRWSICVAALTFSASLAVEIGVASADPGEAAPPAEMRPWTRVPIVMRVPPFEEAGTMMRFEYVATGPATKRWRLCVSVPSSDFSVIAAVIRGIRSEADRKGASITVHDSEAYNIERQRAQIGECIETSDAIIVMGAARRGLESVFSIAHQRGVPVINAGIETEGEAVDARVVPSALAIGEAIGSYLTQRFPEGSEMARVAWFPGPADSGFSLEYDVGFRHGLRHSAVEIAGGGFTGLDEQSLRRALADVLGQDERVDAIAGVGMIIPLAMDALSGSPHDPILLSTAINDEIVTAISQFRVAAAVNSRPVEIGKIAADLAIRALEGRAFMQDVRPRVELVDEASLSQFDRDSALLPTR